MPKESKRPLNSPETSQTPNKKLDFSVNTNSSSSDFSLSDLDLTRVLNETIKQSSPVTSPVIPFLIPKMNDTSDLEMANVANVTDFVSIEVT